MKDFVATRMDMLNALNDVGTWPAREHRARIGKLWNKDWGPSGLPKMVHLALDDDDPLVEPLITALVAQKLLK